MSSPAGGEQPPVEQPIANPYEPVAPTPEEATTLGVGTQGLRFLISGLISAAVDLTVTFVLQQALGATPGASRTGGFILGTLTAYAINRRWTFAAAPSLRRFVEVLVLYAAMFAVNYGLYRFGFELLEGWGWPDWLSIASAFVVAQGTASVVNFFFQRLVIFKNP